MAAYKTGRSRTITMSGFRALELTVADVTKLPAVYTTDMLQTTTGAFIYLTDYSTLGGGDVLG